jgi:hypothetical protein
VCYALRESVVASQCVDTPCRSWVDETVIMGAREINDQGVETKTETWFYGPVAIF